MDLLAYPDRALASRIEMRPSRPPKEVNALLFNGSVERGSRLMIESPRDRKRSRRLAPESLVMIRRATPTISRRKSSRSGSLTMWMER